MLAENMAQLPPFFITKTCRNSLLRSCFTLHVSGHSRSFSPIMFLFSQQCLCQVTDMRNDAVKLFYGPSFEENAEKYVDSCQGHYKKFESWMGQQGTKFTCGDAPTAPDFHLFEMLDQHEILAKFLKTKSFLATENEKGKLLYSNLRKFYGDFKLLPQLQDYFAGDAYKLPINNIVISLLLLPFVSSRS